MTQERAMTIMLQHGIRAVALDDEGTIGLVDDCCRLYALVQWDDGHIVDNGVKMTLYAWLGY